MNDPFVDNATPPWRFPGSAPMPANLETGDPDRRFVPNTVYPVLIGTTVYNPQTEALLPWFSRESRT